MGRSNDRHVAMSILTSISERRRHLLVTETKDTAIAKEDEAFRDATRRVLRDQRAGQALVNHGHHATEWRMHQLVVGPIKFGPEPSSIIGAIINQFCFHC